MRLLYFDTSAAVKLFKEEPESARLEAWLAGQGSALVLTSDLTRTELQRALHAAKVSPEVQREAEAWLDDSAALRLAPAICDRAGSLMPGTRLRSLDALHVASAQALGAALLAFVAYDDRLLEAAQELGLPTESPR
jgi:predicted nucleic acid-binding protein